MQGALGEPAEVAVKLANLDRTTRRFFGTPKWQRRLSERSGGEPSWADLLRSAGVE
jgi:hypothetical protein